jgi:hypothetical protein
MMTPNAIRTGMCLLGFRFTGTKKAKRPEQHKVALVLENKRPGYQPAPSCR